MSDSESKSSLINQRDKDFKNDWKDGKKSYEKYRLRQNELQRNITEEFNIITQSYLKYLSKVGRHSQYNLNIEDLACELLDRAISLRLEERNISDKDINEILPKVEKEHFDYGKYKKWDKPAYEIAKEAMKETKNLLREIIVLINKTISKVENEDWQHYILSRDSLITDTLEKLKLAFRLFDHY